MGELSLSEVELIDDLTEVVAQLQETVERQHEVIEEQQETIESLEMRLDILSNKKVDRLKESVGELQERELEKGGHLREENVVEEAVEVPSTAIEKDDGRYLRAPDASVDSAPNAAGAVNAGDDLLPIQQLARLDDEMLATESKPVRLAAALWRARVRDAHTNPWQEGCKEVREFVNAGDIRAWIRREEDGVSEEYGKKLASRTISALVDLSKGRLAVKKKNRRTDGLRYTERRVVLFDHAEIPGESVPSASDPGTSVVHGD